jgi:hypothetical protein
VPKYYIDLRDQSGLIRDHEGRNFADLEAALDEAKASARDLVRQYMDRQIPLSETCVEVRDNTGQTIAAVTVSEVLQHPVHPDFKSRCAEFPRDGDMANRPVR